VNSLFIVLEGIDGSGTSTQAELLKAYFRRRGEKAVVSPEPSDGPIGKLIRGAMQGQFIVMQNQEKFDEQMAYLFAADRHYHLYNDTDGVFKLIEREGTHVITTRYYFSSLAYNCNSDAEFVFVRDLNQKFPNPDIVIYLDIPIEVSLDRIRDRSIKEIYETAEKLQKVKENFVKVFANYSGTIWTIDGTQAIDSVHQQIVTYLERKR
jgi:dTMP kinase